MYHVCKVGFVFALAASSAVSQAAEYHVSALGNAKGDGSQAAPWPSAFRKRQRLLLRGKLLSPAAIPPGRIPK